MARDWRDDRIDELERENAALRAEIREQQSIIETRQRMIAVLEQRVEQLETRLRGLEAILVLRRFRRAEAERQRAAAPDTTPKGS